MRPEPRILQCRSCRIEVLEMPDGCCSWCDHPPRAKPTEASLAMAAIRTEAWARFEAGLAEALAERAKEAA